MLRRVLHEAFKILNKHVQKQKKCYKQKIHWFKR